MENFLDFFTVDVWTTVFTLVNMFIMLAIVKKLLFKPVMKILNDREAEVKRMYDDARQANEKATSMEKEYSEKMAQARNEAGEIIKQATLTAHEEVAYDVFQLENDGPVRGIGRIGQLAEPMSMAEFLAFTGQQLQCDHLTYQGDLQKKIQRVALCGGSGISYLKAARNAGADVYVTGDMKYHDGQLASELGMNVIDAGHFGTERLITQAMAEFARQQGVECVVFEEEQDYLQHWVRIC